MGRGERGSSSVMIIGFALVVLLLVVAVVDAGAAYLERQGLDSLADGAALYAADAAAEGREVYDGGLGGHDLHLSADVARAAVSDYLRATGAYADHPGLHAAVSVRGDRVVVEVAANLDLPLDLPGAPTRPVVRATGSAVVRPETGESEAARFPVAGGQFLATWSWVSGTEHRPAHVRESGESREPEC